nr:hypothetical protein [uncultured bacterium]
MQSLIQEIALIDGIIEPVVTSRPLDITGPDWLEPPPDPLAKAGIGAEAEQALRAIIEVYESGDEATREAVRGVFERYRYFRWAVHIEPEPTVDGFRFWLLHFSAIDQGDDARDELLNLGEIRRRAEQAGVDLRPLLLEVAELSSDADKYGMGSTRQFLLNAAGA